MSTYCTQANIEATFGTNNVARWAKLSDSDDASTVTARITRAIAVASEDIDDVLRFAGIAIPCVTAAGATPTTITQICADLAGVWLYEARGVDDVDREGNPRHRLQYHADRAYRKLDLIAQRKIQINCISNTG